MTVYEMMRLFLDDDLQRFRLYDLSKPMENNIIYDGFLPDLPLKYERLEVLSIDNLTGETGETITLNVDTDE